jgi:hypothetical protein
MPNDSTQMLSQKYRKLKEQGKNWREIFKQTMEDIAVSMELVFTKSKKARRTFEVIVSDFYTRPEYWSQLFEACLEEWDLQRIGTTVAQYKLNPIVASQFIDTDSRTIALKYLGHLSEQSTRNISVLQNLQGDVGYEAAIKFYKEYFVRDADEQEVLLFWHFVLNSVIRDMMQQTNRKKIARALSEKQNYIRKNIRPLENALKNLPMIQVGTIQVQGQKIVVQNTRLQVPRSDISLVAKRILDDASSNWVFSLPVRIFGESGIDVKDVVVVGPRYIAKKLRTKNNILIDKGQSLTLARDWVQRMIEQKSFPTFVTEKDSRYDQIYYEPVDIVLSNKPTKDYEIKTISRDVAFQFIKSDHSAIDTPNPRGFIYAIGVYDDDKLISVATLNTSQVKKGAGYEGQHHFVEISRIVVPDAHRGEGLATMLTQWIIDNKELFNRSQYEEADIVTYSLLREPGTVYRSVKTVYPIGLVKPRKPEAKLGRKNVVLQDWKIRWDSNPNKNVQIKKWLVHLHPLYMKLYYGINSYTGSKLQSRKVSKSDFRYFKTTEQLLDVMRILWILPSKFGKPTQQRLIDFINNTWIQLLPKIINGENNIHPMISSAAINAGSINIPVFDVKQIQEQTPRNKTNANFFFQSKSEMVIVGLKDVHWWSLSDIQLRKRMLNHTLIPHSPNWMRSYANRTKQIPWASMLGFKRDIPPEIKTFPSDFNLFFQVRKRKSSKPNKTLGDFVSRVEIPRSFVEKYRSSFDEYFVVED